MSKSSPTYALARHESTREGFVRVMGQLAVRARDLIQPSPAPLEKRIHQGRTLIKRTRTLLWFAKPALDPEAFAQARTQLRNAAALMAAQRDFVVTQATVRKLARKRSTPQESKTLADLLQTLAQNSPVARLPKRSLRQMLRKAMWLLVHVIDEIEQNVARRTGWKPPRKRLAKAFRVERLAEKKVRRDGTDVDFHEWRKQAKRLLYLLELTRKLPCGHGAGVRRQVHALQETLGDYHDCVVAEEAIHPWHATLPCARDVLRRIEKRKMRLGKKALSA